MPHYSPRRRNRAAILRIFLIPLLAVAAIALLLLNEHAFRRKSENFTTLTVTAEDTRIRPIAGYAVEYGSKPLYQVEVLATYTQSGTSHEDWLSMSEAPHSQSVAQAEADALKGHTVTLRWDPATPEQKLVTAP